MKKWIFFLAVVTSVVFIPALKMGFWWVDDGWTIMMAQKILSGDLYIIFNEAGGRLRIVYWLFQTITYLFSGANPTLYFFIHYIVILITAFLIFRIVYQLTKSNLSSFFSSVMFVLTPINNENLYRLGPQEPLLCLFIVASIYLLIRKKIYPSITFLLLAALTKENGFLLWIPVFFFFISKILLLKKRDRTLEKYCLWGLIFSIPFVLNLFLRNGGYSTNYIFDVNQIVINFLSYVRLLISGLLPFFAFFLSSFFVRLILCFKDKKYKMLDPGLLFQTSIIIFVLVFIAAQSPWKYVLDRYLMPETLGLVIFMGLEIAGIKKALEIWKFRWTKFLALIFIIYLLSFIVVTTIQIYNYGGGFSHQTRFIQTLYKNLSDEVPNNGMVLLNFLVGDSTAELVTQTDMQLDLIYKRPDIQVMYLDINNLPKENYIIVGTQTTREEYPRQLVEKSIGKYHKDGSLILEDKYIVLTNTNELFKQIVKKFYQLIINNQQFTRDGIYTYSIQKDYWYKYYVGK